jgi:hypothetical protein
MRAARASSNRARLPAFPIMRRASMLRGREKVNVLTPVDRAAKVVFSLQACQFFCDSRAAPPWLGAGVILRRQGDPRSGAAVDGGTAAELADLGHRQDLQIQAL